MTGRELNKLWKDYFVVSFVSWQGTTQAAPAAGNVHGAATPPSPGAPTMRYRVLQVRNPFQRAVSMYRMFMREVELGGTEDRTYTWNQFCADPAGFGAKCEADEKCKT